MITSCRYADAKPVAKGWDNKRGRAVKGRADTHVTAHDGRAVCFATGEPSGLTVTLAAALAELTKAAGPGAKIRRVSAACPAPSRAIATSRALARPSGRFPRRTDGSCSPSSPGGSSPE